jgi:regulatory protein YycH of two-component signal transduction system YycFG
MLSTSWILFGVIVLIAVVVIWKWWKKPVNESKKNDDLAHSEPKMITEEETGPPESTTEPPPMVFAVNDEGNLDLTDITGKILNIGYGHSPKTYVGLLHNAESDVEKFESDSGVTFSSKVGTTKLYEVAGRPYIINYTRL